MRKSKCDNCGANLETTYTKEGVRVLICPHVKTQIVKSGIGNLRHLEIYCHTTKTGTTQQIAPKTDAVYRYEKEVNLNAKTEALQTAFQNLVANSDHKTLTIEKLRNAVNKTVSDDKILEYANLALMLELPALELPTLFNSAMKLGYATGLTTEKAIQSLSIGIGRQSRLVLDNIGIVFKASEAYAWFKETHNVSKLTDVQRRKVWIEYAIKLIREKAEKLSITSQSKKTRIEQLYARLTNARSNFGKRALQQ